MVSGSLGGGLVTECQTLAKCFYQGGAAAERGEVTCPVSHSWQAAEPGGKRSRPTAGPSGCC